MHSLGLNKAFFFSCAWYCHPSAAWRSLAWCICLWRERKKKKNTCISFSQLNCSEVLPSRTGQMWGLNLQSTTPSLSPLIPPNKSLSITAAAVVLWIPLVFFLSATKGVWEGHLEMRNKLKTAFLLLLLCRSRATCVVCHAMTYHCPKQCCTTIPILV